MSEPLVILDKVVYDKYIKEFETLIEYHNTKLEKFETKIQKILGTFKSAFNEQTKDMLLSHGDKFISVQTNPFAPQALKESINISKIDKNNKKLEELIEAIKKFRSLQNQQQTGMKEKFQEIVKKENSYHINFGQLTALATTQVGQAIGMT